MHAMVAAMRSLLVPSSRSYSQRCLFSGASHLSSPIARQGRNLSLNSPRRWTSSAASPPPAAQMPFTYSVAASYIGKDRPYDPATHVFHFNPHHRIQPNNNKRLRPESGQDAFFVSRVGDTGGVALGVADGVGGWMDSGVDPADFSHGLCGNMASVAYAHRPSAPPAGPQDQQLPSTPAASPPLTARRLLQLGYDAVCSDRSIPAGGSTAVVALLQPEGTLEVANLGDSGFVQLRANAVHAASTPQIHAFNTPFQLSVIPPGIMARMAMFGGAQLSDMPRDAEVTRHGLRHGDVLVFASDGVWDNLFNQDILRVVCSSMAAVGAWEATDSGTKVAADLTPFTRPDMVAADQGAKAKPVVTLQSLIATEITAAAKAASVNRKLDGPFAKEVKKYFPRDNWRGGKVDDICVVVAIVSEGSAATSEPKLKSRL
ncbi:hypothetical protein MCOR25_001105 [Pyricularia grisea]|nr:hypothetical protein MCOR25_001105 [Pyricularia grisea]